MVLKNDIKPGLILVVNDRGNKISDDYRIYTLDVFEPKTIGWNAVEIETGEVIKCLSEVKKMKGYPFVVVYLEYNGNEYVTYWTTLRIQTDIAAPDKIEEYEIKHSMKKYNL